MSDTPDLLDVLQPPPSEDDARPVGTIRGEVEGLGAGLWCWCGPGIGWRQFGDARAHGQLLRHEGRLSVAVRFDLGPAPPVRRGG